MSETSGTTVLTYGTFDLFHIGHVRLLERLAELGDRLVVGVSTDAFNETKGKRSVVPYEDRAAIVSAIKGVDLVIPEESWEQKAADIAHHGVSIFAMGDDWAGKFDDLKSLCEVVYLPRTEGISTSEVRSALSIVDPSHLAELAGAIETVSAFVAHYQRLD